jgi:adenosine deaminase
MCFKSPIISTKNFIRNLPKVELHLHLEGVVTPTLWYKLRQKHSQLKKGETIDHLAKRFKYNSFLDFLETFKDVLDSFKDPSDFYDLTHHLLNSLIKQNTRYCEVMFTPYFATRKGINLQEILQEIKNALVDCQKTADIEMKLIFDGPRNFGNRIVKTVFEQALEDKTGLVIGVGLGGDEANFPARDFIEEFKFAKANGLNLIAHAGETAGEQSMIDSIELLGVSRIGHCLGIRKGSSLEHLIQEMGITLDLCPWSNVATKAIDSIHNHPFLKYQNRGYSLTLNTDDPGFFQTSLNQEFETVQTLYQLTSSQLVQLSKNAVAGSFLPTKSKKDLSVELDNFL